MAVLTAPRASRYKGEGAVTRMQMFYRAILVLTALVYGAMALWSLPRLAGFSDGALILDMRLGGYDAGQVRALLDALGEEGRAFYLTRQQALDSALPALLALLLILSFRRLYARGPALALSVLALVYAAFDYGENALIARMLAAGPDLVTPALADAASRLTTAKFAALAIALAALAPGLWQRWRYRRALR